jgi:hypothetical protein
MDVPVPSFGGEHTIVERLKRAELILDTISKDITPDGRASQSAGSGSQSGLSQASSQDRNADRSPDQSRQGSEGSQLGPWSDTGEVGRPFVRDLIMVADT